MVHLSLALIKRRPPAWPAKEAARPTTRSAILRACRSDDENLIALLQITGDFGEIAGGHTLSYLNRSGLTIPNQQHERTLQPLTALTVRSILPPLASLSILPALPTLTGKSTLPAKSTLSTSANRRRRN